jgi:hypothetical protein
MEKGELYIKGYILALFESPLLGVMFWLLGA